MICSDVHIDAVLSCQETFQEQHKRKDCANYFNFIYLILSMIGQYVKEAPELIISLKWKISFCLFALVWVSCATGERFGESDSLETISSTTDSECKNNAGCWDGDPLTTDICSEDGYCINEPVPTSPDSGTGFIEDNCFIQKEINDSQLGGADLFSAINVSRGATDVSYTAPLDNGSLIKISIEKRPRRLWIRPSKGEINDVTLVLLRDCYNTSFNRIAWGQTIITDELPRGDYYLAVFSSRERTILDMDTFFLDQTHCADAEIIEPNNTVEVSTAGLSDDFNGNCLGSYYPKGHRGDKVYKFSVPQGFKWNVSFRMVALDNTDLAYWMYVKAGCGNPLLANLACVSVPNPIQGVALLNRKRTDTKTRKNKDLTLTVQDLAQGDYYLFVDTLDTNSFEEQMQELTMTVDSSSVI